MCDPNLNADSQSVYITFNLFVYTNDIEKIYRTYAVLSKERSGSTT